MAVQEGIKFCVKDGTRIPDEIIIPSFTDTDSPATQPTAPQKSTSKTLLIVLIALIAVAATIVSILAIILFTNNANQAEREAGLPHTETQNYDAAIDTWEITQPSMETAPPTTPQPTEPAVTYEYYYEIIQSDMSWIDAKAACEARGGYLATITSVEEYNEICRLANETDLIYLWLGACLPSKNTSWDEAGWITGENWTFENWYPGEPSKQDTDGTVETYLCMWTVKDGPWTFNDQRNDIVAALPSISGRVGYVCEYKIEVIQ